VLHCKLLPAGALFVLLIPYTALGQLLVVPESAQSTGSPNSTGGARAASWVTPTVTQASRLLDQTTFGVRAIDITNVQQIGLDAYIAEQLNTPQTALGVLSDPLPKACMGDPGICFESEFWQTALTAPDQLRQRVAFALSEMWVTSTQVIDGNAAPQYYNTLAKDAFTNWRTIMEDVTLSPAMGQYLSMVNSSKAPAGQIANENYAREMMQLFSIGPVMLNPDATAQTDASGDTIPAYTEAQVQAFARVYTGWTYATSTGAAPTSFPSYVPNYSMPMAAVDSAHDTTSKTLLNNVVLPAGQSTSQDLEAALDNIFAHPNLPPFICKQLIQHLVTSTPSSAYVERVSQVFIDNGSGVRGDMSAVITAILMDTEARAGDWDPNYDGGHLREPVLYLTNVMQALKYMDINTGLEKQGAYVGLRNYTSPLGEIPLRSSSVFNFFSPSYVVPGTTLNAPEFGLENTAAVQQRLTLADQLAENQIAGFNGNLTVTSAMGQLAGNPSALVDKLGVMFLHGRMPRDMKEMIVNEISSLTDIGQRVRVAVYLVISSSEYKVMH
jgi:uncharacterized protein (DUF1800 family)